MMKIEIEQIGNCTLYCGDCLEVISEIEKVDAVLTDPPYTMKIKSSGTHSSFWGDVMNASVFFTQILLSCKNKIDNGLIWQFFNWKTFSAVQKSYCDAGLDIESVLVWNKGGLGTSGPNGLRPQYELCSLALLGTGRIKNRAVSDVVHVPGIYGAKRIHPAEKPLDLIIHLVLISESTHVLDPFMGSGTTGVACVNLDRKFIGIEIERKYFDIACKRIEQAVKEYNAMEQFFKEDVEQKHLF